MLKLSLPESSNSLRFLNCLVVQSIPALLARMLNFCETWRQLQRSPLRYSLIPRRARWDGSRKLRHHHWSSPSRSCHCPILTRDRGKVRGLTLGSHGAAQTPSLDLGGLHIGGRGNPDARNKRAGKTLGKKKQSLWATQTNSQTNSNQTNS